MKFVPNIFCILAISFILPATLFAQTFTKIIFGEIVNDGGISTGCSWGDYDNDGYLDLFVADNNGNNFLYQNNGNGTFTKITTGVIVNDGGRSISNSWGDFDNDGYLDLFVTNAGPTPDTPDFLYRNDGKGSFSKITGSIVVSDSGRSVGSSWVDYDNDGDLDLWVDNENLSNDPAQNNSLYRNDGNGDFTQITTGGIVNDGGASIGSSWADYDNDGDQDLFVPNQAGENNFLYRNEGNGTFTRITTGDIANDGGESKACSWADYDNDGDLDLFVANASPVPGEDNFLYRNEGNGNFTKITGGNIVNDGGPSRGNGWADIDNDGDLDLFVANTGDNNFLYQNNGDGTFRKIISGAIVNDGGVSLGSSWGDYDNDGDLDLYVANLGDNNFLYRNKGNSNHWINILCIGTVSNTTAIGAKVRVKATINGAPVWQLRDIASQRGYAGQNSLNAEFGLGDATIIDSLKIEWPSDTIDVFTNVLVNSFYTATEGQDLVMLSFPTPQPDFWEPVNSSPGGTISAFAFNANGDIFAGGSGVHRSTDNGNSWTFLGNVLGSQGIRDLVINTSGIIFAATDRNVYSSTDNGDNWRFHLIAAFDGIDVISLAANSKGDVFAGMRSDGMFRSTDNGNTWTEIRAREEIFDIVVNANDDIFIGTRSRVFRSTDNGAFWESASDGINRPEVLTLGVNSNNDLFAYVLGDGLVRSTDNGENWIGILDGSVGVFSAFAFNSEGHIFAGGCIRCTPIPGAYRSTDGGENWTEINNGLASFNVATLAIGNDDQIFAGTPEGVFRSAEVTTAVDEPAAIIPSFFVLEQNYPNPFNPVTTIEFDVPNTAHIELTMYNVLGKKVETLVSKKYSAGKYRVQWSANNFSSGVYFYQLKAEGFVQTRKLLLLK